MFHVEHATADNGGKARARKRDWLTPREVGRELGVSDQTILNAIKDGMPVEHRDERGGYWLKLDASTKWYKSNRAGGIHGGRRKRAGRKPKSGLDRDRDRPLIVAAEKKAIGVEDQDEDQTKPVGLVGEQILNVRAQRELRELELQEKRGRLVDADWIGDRIAECLARVKQVQDSRGRRLAGRIATALRLTQDQVPMVQRIIDDDTAEEQDELSRIPEQVERELAAAAASGPRKKAG